MTTIYTRVFTCIGIGSLFLASYALFFHFVIALPQARIIETQEAVAIQGIEHARTANSTRALRDCLITAQDKFDLSAGRLCWQRTKNPNCTMPPDEEDVILLNIQLRAEQQLCASLYGA